MYLSRCALIVLSIVLTATLAEAQATRTWVSGVGDDANPCSRTAPCKTFAGAISKTAAGGEINALDSGGFGAVTITKSIAIVAEGVIGGVLASATNGIIVNAGANDTVVLRGLDINGAGTTLGLNGIRFLAGRWLHVENCMIYNFSQRGIDAVATTAGAHLFVKDSFIRNTGGGIFLGGNVSGTIDRTRVERNTFGVRAESAGDITILNSSMVRSTGAGIIAVAGVSPLNVNVDTTLSAHNGQSGIHSAGGNASVRLTNSTIIGNATGLSTAGGAIVSFGNNRVFGNTVNGAPTATELLD